MKTISLSIVQRGLVTLLVVCGLVTAPAFGQNGDDYVLSWSTIDGGGGTSSGGPYVLTGTIGQPDAAWSAGGNFELLGGFWPGGPICIVDFESYARFAKHWLEEDCSELNNWCDGADLNHLNGVNSVDLKLFIDQWLCYCPVGWPLK